ncbi:uncharacterized protein LOC130723480 isoform X2 [Lotus japonicus]|uniref:uncharacterized protein LOC130723480 isoform X2 n=1 Tax=Lotus japonicus TaxID=34305 RepID=UPI00258C4D82|nr:uncharacterized protein LOC130723480 isoform X2 [Lotus japonicus]
MGKKPSLRTKATDFVYAVLNPISDSNDHNHKPSKHPPSPSEEVGETEISASETSDEEGSHGLDGGPDTSSFTAFLYSFVSSSDTKTDKHGQNDEKSEPDNINPLPDSSLKENGRRKSLFSRGKQSLGRAIRHATRIGGFRHHDRRKDNVEMKYDDGHCSKISTVEPVKESVHRPLVDLPEISEPSVLLSEGMRSVLYASLPPLVHGRKWLLLYSTWRHGVTLSTLYRRSMLSPGSCLLVVGDQRGAVFGSLVEAPMRPSNRRKYQILYLFREQTIHMFSQTSLVILLYIAQQGLTAISRFATLTT